VQEGVLKIGVQHGGEVLVRLADQLD